MPRKRLTQIFPFLLPLRKWQRKKFFYAKMNTDGNRYARGRAGEPLPIKVFEASSLLINQNTGFDLKYQFNKVHNLKLAARTIDGVPIKPGETFSFWKLAGRADSYVKYKEGLSVADGEIRGAYGGGLCQLSGLLYWMFLHTPLTVTERRGHDELHFPAADGKLPCGVDATVSEGWIDLKAENHTDNVFRIGISFDRDYMYGDITAAEPVNVEYEIYNPEVCYRREGGKVFQTAAVCRRESDKNTGFRKERELYVNRCEIAYEPGPDVIVREGDGENDKKE